MIILSVIFNTNAPEGEFRSTEFCIIPDLSD